MHIFKMVVRSMEAVLMFVCLFVSELSRGCPFPFPLSWAILPLKKSLPHKLVNKLVKFVP